MDKVIRRKELLALIGMKKSWLAAAVRENRFPPGFKIGARARGWTASSIDEWITGRIAIAEAEAEAAGTSEPVR